ncbi:MAG: hypothetical protein FWD88_03365 [Treponema sp.]|nr:hypothetical protein [Treponema sp.]
MKYVFALLFLLTAGLGLQAERLPEWMVNLREAIYEQVLTAEEVRPLYVEAQAAARRNTSGANRYLTLSRAEFFMGRALLFEERNREARPHFAEGLRLAERAVEMSPSADAWVLRAENLAHLIQTSNWTFAMANGLDVERFARNALEFDSRNAAAQYLIAARWIFAPRAFANINRGIEMMTAILTEGDMARDDHFNVVSAIGWAHIQQRNFGDAVPWLRRALEVYPTNKFAADLLETAEAGGGRRRSR